LYTSQLQPRRSDKPGGAFWALFKKEASSNKETLDTKKPLNGATPSMDKTFQKHFK
jgi:hypothetical protein